MKIKSLVPIILLLSITGCTALPNQEPASFTVKAVTVIPAAPKLSVAAAFNTSSILQWNTVPKAVYYKVFGSGKNMNNFLFSAQRNLAFNAGRGFTYSVRACTGTINYSTSTAGCGDQSNAVNVR